MLIKLLRALGQKCRGEEFWSENMDRATCYPLDEHKMKQAAFVKHLPKIFSLLNPIKDDTKCHNYNSTSPKRRVESDSKRTAICRKCKGLRQMGPPLEWGTACTVMNVK